MDKKLSVEMLRMQDFQFNEEEMIVLCGGRSTNETSSERDILVRQVKSIKLWYLMMGMCTNVLGEILQTLFQMVF